MGYTHFAVLTILKIVISMAYIASKEVSIKLNNLQKESDVETGQYQLCFTSINTIHIGQRLIAHITE